MPTASRPPEKLMDTLLPRCSACHTAEYQLKGKLKRCAGCAATMYCSKECQKKAWPQHKLTCRAEWNSDPAFSVPGADGQSIGHPPESVAAIESASLDWAEAHLHELRVIATASVYLHGGFSQHFSGPDSTRVLVFVLQPLPNCMSSILSRSLADSPGKGFHLLHIGSMSRTEFLADSHANGVDGAALWAAAHASCRQVEANVHALDPGLRRGLVRAIPAIFNVTHSPNMRFQSILLFPQSAERQRALDAEARAVFEDVRSLCITVMARGLVLRVQTEGKAEPDPCPDVGVMVRRKKKRWEWEEVPDWDWGRATADSTFPKTSWKTELHPHELWKRFHDF